MSAGLRAYRLRPCPFCGGETRLERCTDTYEREFGNRKWYGVCCRNTSNRGGSCAIHQVPSASPEVAVDRWNMRDGKLAPEWAAPPGMSEGTE